MLSGTFFFGGCVAELRHSCCSLNPHCVCVGSMGGYGLYLGFVKNKLAIQLRMFLSFGSSTSVFGSWGHGTVGSDDELWEVEVGWLLFAYSLLRCRDLPQVIGFRTRIVLYIVYIRLFSKTYASRKKTLALFFIILKCKCKSWVSIFSAFKKFSLT